MKTKQLILLTLLLVGGQLFAQEVVVKSGSIVMSGSVNLVLDDMSLTNEATVDGSDGVLVLQPFSAKRLVTTSSDITLDGLTLSGAGGTARLEGGLDVNDLTINANHILEVSETSGFTLNTSLTSSGDLTVASGGSLIIKPAVPSVGNVTLSRTTTFDKNTGKYSVVGSPVESSSFYSLGTNAQSWIFEYAESTAYGTNGVDRFQSPTESIMTPGKGYFSAYTGDENGSITFYGVPNYKNLQYAVTRTDNASDPSEVEGFNLLSNPFTSPVSFSQFVTTNTSVLEEETIWIWDDIASDAGGGDATQDYITVSNLGNTDSRGGRLSDWDGTINVAQGFFVKAASNGNITFNHAMKTHDGNDDASFFRTMNEEVERYWISIADESGTLGSNTLIGFKSDATNDFDKQYDASKFGTSFSVYSLLEDRKLAIQALSESWVDGADDQVIPLGYYAPSKGGFTMSLQRSSYPSGIPLYLNDHLNGTSVNITEEAYSFQSQAGSYNDRFSLSLAPLRAESILGLKSHQLDIHAYGVAGAVKVKSQQTGELALWTLEGKRVAEQSMSIGEMEIKVPAKGLYLLTVQTREGNATYKIMVEN